MMLSNLQDFGEGKFRRIVELLKRGAPSTLIVQLIQEQWGGLLRSATGYLGQGTGVAQHGSNN
jgi:hypothetical protein